MKKVIFFVLSTIVQLIVLFNIGYLFNNGNYAFYATIATPIIFTFLGLMIVLIKSDRNYFGWGLLFGAITSFSIGFIYFLLSFGK